MSQKPSVLVVDDDPRLCQTLVDILRLKDYQAEPAYSGPQALEKANQTQFDCLLTDIRMPEMNGVELYRAIKEERPRMPAVLMTAYSTDKLVQEGLEEGAVACLIKPLDIDNLLRSLSSLRPKG